MTVTELANELTKWQNANPCYDLPVVISDMDTQWLLNIDTIFHGFVEGQQYIGLSGESHNRFANDAGVIINEVEIK